MSDLHLEFFDDAGRSFIDAIDSSNTDVLVLAGDITALSLMPETIRRFAAKFADADIVYVLGNHEFYGGYHAEIVYRAKALSVVHPNVHVLENDTALIRGLRFFGSTMWYPFDAWNFLERDRWSSWSDARHIKNAKKVIPPLFPKAQQAMEEQLEPGDIVVTHMLPTPKSIAPQFAGARTNAYFLGDCSAIIAAKRPRLWIHGHTHSGMDYMYGETRVVANPAGLHWLNENPKFDINQTIEF
jgi:Predicted phosphoesterases, related to the Icc protein